MATFSSWVNGNSAEAQDPGVRQRMARLGWGIEFTYDPTVDNPEQFFHVPIPTPTVIQDHWGHLVRVMILFKTTFSGRIDRIDLWNGGSLISQHNVNFSGDHSADIEDDKNIVYAADEPWVPFGLGVSLHLVHDVNDNAVLGLVAAGADFRADV